MGSSVEFSHTFDLWNVFLLQNEYTNHTPKKWCDFLGHFSSSIIG